MGKHLEIARRVLDAEAEAIRAVGADLDDAFSSAVERLLAIRGKVIVTGIGKSGHIASKIAATLASTGTPAFFVHPVEAAHGDMGMISGDDAVVAISRSGESGELAPLLSAVRRIGACIVALCGAPDSALARASDVCVKVGVSREACPMDLAPTASTTAALAVGDALAIALLEARGFSHEDFARAHPGGALGRRLLTRIEDVMRTGDTVPTVSEQATVTEAIVEMTGKQMGMTLVVADGGKLAGIFTDGDLRRALERGGDVLALPVSKAMTAKPATVSPEQMATEAAAMMAERRINQVPVVDNSGAIVGALNAHDLMAHKVM